MTLVSKYLLRIFLIILVSSSNIHAQWGLKEMINLKLGETFSDSKKNISLMFPKKAEIMKGDFLGASKIEYEDMPFDYYGNSNYSFQYVKDTLVAMRVEFTFLANDTAKFRRLYNTLINDLNNDYEKELLNHYSNLNYHKVMGYIKENCIRTKSKDDVNYKPIKSAYLGQNIWAIKGTNSFQKKFLKVFVQLGEFHSYNYGSHNFSNYDGGQVYLVIELTNEHFQGLKNKEEEMDMKYTIRKDLNEAIKMKSVNGTYSVPIKLNNALTIDFVLDLGASDVSISPDVFLVLFKAGTIDDGDFIGTETYRFADGSSAKSSVFNIKSIQIGGKEIKNIRASISKSVNSPLLLGQSAMKKFDSYRIDNNEKLLIIE